jgi:hypothetical protein
MIAYDITFNAPQEVRKDCVLCAGEGHVSARLGNFRYTKCQRAIIELGGFDPDDPPKSRCCPVCDCGLVVEDDPPP